MTDSSAIAGAALADWPPTRPQLLRVYARARDFRRQAAHLARAGWLPVTVTTDRSPFVLRALNVLSCGLLLLIPGLKPALHVTYSTR